MSEEQQITAKKTEIQEMKTICFDCIAKRAKNENIEEINFKWTCVVEQHTNFLWLSVPPQKQDQTAHFGVSQMKHLQSASGHS